jgi:hypothetical protein
VEGPDARGGGGCVAIFGVFRHEGTRRIVPRYLASQRLGKLFGSVEVVREILAGIFLTIGMLLYTFGYKFLGNCCLSWSKLAKYSFLATKCDGWRTVGEHYEL